MSNASGSGPEELRRLFAFQEPPDPETALILAQTFSEMAKTALESRESGWDEHSLMGSLICARNAAGQALDLLQELENVPGRTWGETEEARRSGRQSERILAQVGAAAGGMSLNSGKTDLETAKEVWFLAVCHTELVREKSVRELMVRTALADSPQDAVRSAAAAQIAAMWPPLLTEMEPPPERRGAKQYRQAALARARTESALRRIAEGVNARITLEVSPWIRYLPELEREAAGALVPPAGCAAGFIHGPELFSRRPPERMLESCGAYLEAGPEDGPWAGAAAWVTFVHGDRRIAKLMIEPYPCGYPGPAALENAERAEEILAACLAEEEVPKDMAEYLKGVVRASRVAAEQGIHAIAPQELHLAMREAHSNGMSRGAGTLMFKGLTRSDPALGRFMARDRTLQRFKSASLEQAMSVASAARETGMDEHAVAELARAMGYRPAELGAKPEEPGPENLERVIRSARDAGVPLEAVAEMTRALENYW